MLHVAGDLCYNLDISAKGKSTPLWMFLLIPCQQ